MVYVTEAPTIWNLLKGVICIYKPAGISAVSVRKILLGNVCRGEVRMSWLLIVFRSCIHLSQFCKQLQTFIHRPLRIRKSATYKACFYRRKSINIIKCTCCAEFCWSSTCCWSEVSAGRFPLYVGCTTWQKCFGSVWYVITLCCYITSLCSFEAHDNIWSIFWLTSCLVGSVAC
jgi:hypothetical protein